MGTVSREAGRRHASGRTAPWVADPSQDATAPNAEGDSSHVRSRATVSKRGRAVMKGRATQSHGIRLSELASRLRDAQPRWHRGYYLLATLGLVTICLSLFLMHRLRQIYTDSVRVDQEWALRLADYSMLGRLAGAVNGPVSDVFQSHDQAVESDRLQRAKAS